MRIRFIISLLSFHPERHLLSVRRWMRTMQEGVTMPDIFGYGVLGFRFRYSALFFLMLTPATVYRMALRAGVCRSSAGKSHFCTGIASSGWFLVGPSAMRTSF
ncbi:MAG: hypothetical protein GPOALKHO_000299 [Sodalis sp.]|nr:MAG: hypothetical protein GPOALKHO_000299 [Sodalis sp.]